MKPTTARTLKWFRKKGYIADRDTVVEKYHHITKKRYDYRGLFDAIVFHPQKPGVVGVQTTSSSAHREHINKMTDEFHLPRLTEWTGTGRRAILISWRKLKVGNRKLWKPRIVEFFNEKDKITYYEKEKPRRTKGKSRKR